MLKTEGIEKKKPYVLSIDLLIVFKEIRMFRTVVLVPGAVQDLEISLVSTYIRAFLKYFSVNPRQILISEDPLNSYL